MVPLQLCLFIFLTAVAYTAGRQMCMSCQYVDNPKQEGIECATAPHNWTYGDTRMRCNFRCTIQAHFDKDSGMPVYFYRGCSLSNDATTDDCYEDENREYCTSSCVDEDYCNNNILLPSSSSTSGTVKTAYRFADILVAMVTGSCAAARVWH